MPERSNGQFPHYSGHLLRRRAARGMGEQFSEQQQVARLFITKPETRHPEVHIADAEDVTKGLGLPVDQRQRLAKTVEDMNVEFSIHGGTQRLVQARGQLIEVMRAMEPHIPSDARQAVLKRALTYWKKTQNTDLNREPRMRYVIQKSLTVDEYKVLDDWFPLMKSDEWAEHFDAWDAINDLIKAKYIKRIPTGNPKRPWRYIYKKDVERQRKAEAWEKVKAAARRDDNRTHGARGERVLHLGDHVAALPIEVLQDAFDHIKGKFGKTLQNHLRDLISHKKHLLGHDEGKPHPDHPHSKKPDKSDVEAALKNTAGVPVGAMAVDAMLSFYQNEGRHIQRDAELVRTVLDRTATQVMTTGTERQAQAFARYAVKAMDQLRTERDATTSQFTKDKLNVLINHLHSAGHRLYKHFKGQGGGASTTASTTAPKLPKSASTKEAAQFGERLIFDKEGRGKGSPDGWDRFLKEGSEADLNKVRDALIDAGQSKKYISEMASAIEGRFGSDSIRRHREALAAEKSRKEAKESVSGAPSKGWQKVGDTYELDTPQGKAKLYKDRGRWKVKVGNGAEKDLGKDASFDDAENYLARRSEAAKVDTANAPKSEQQKIEQAKEDRKKAGHVIGKGKDRRIVTAYADKKDSYDYLTGGDIVKVHRVKGEFALHKRDGHRGPQWIVTHIPTGFSVGAPLENFGESGKKNQKKYMDLLAEHLEEGILNHAEFGKSPDPKNPRTKRAFDRFRAINDAMQQNREVPDWAKKKDGREAKNYSNSPESSDPPKDVPRGEAEENTKQMVDSGEYVNDRASRIEQRGEDVLGSARHKAAEWKSLREALDSDKADEMFTRDFLARHEPIDFISRAQEGGALHAIHQLFLNQTAKKFPAKPEIFYPRSSRNVAYVEGKLNPYLDPSSPRAAHYHFDNVSPEDHVKRQRQSYYEAYQEVRKLMEWHSRSAKGGPTTDFRALTGDIRHDLNEMYNDFYRNRGRYDAGTQALRKMINSIRPRLKSSPVRQLQEFVAKADEKFDGADRAERTKAAALHVLEGKSVNSAFGEKKKKEKNDIDIREQYDTDVMIRKGPPSQYKSAKQALNALDKHSGGKYQMRAVQWGKSVTDEEREHHLKSTVDAFHDLTDILDLPPEMASYNGRLAMAIGARGKAGALAHYEPDKKVINLTRANGAGALAHEWGHFFDNVLHQAATGRNGYASNNVGFISATQRYEEPTTVHRALTSLKSSAGWKMFSKRLGDVLGKSQMSKAKKTYWHSDHEMFARAFERHVQRKLHKAGRENTYLVATRKSASSKDGLWPTDEEVDAMSAYFDKVFDELKASPMLKKAFKMVLQRAV